MLVGIEQRELLEQVQRYLLSSAEVKRLAASICSDSVVRAAQVMAACFSAGGKLLICGNGGSAADSQHVASEFVSTLTRDFERQALPAIALCADTAFVTARANDFGFESIFTRQIEAFGSSGDVLLAISTSGDSKNVVRAVQKAADMGLTVVALSGRDGGTLGKLAHVVINVPSTVTSHIQEAHIAIVHSFCYLVERLLYGRDSS